MEQCYLICENPTHTHILRLYWLHNAGQTMLQDKQNFKLFLEQHKCQEWCFDEMTKFTSIGAFFAS